MDLNNKWLRRSLKCLCIAAVTFPFYHSAENVLFRASLDECTYLDSRMQLEACQKNKYEKRKQDYSINYFGISLLACLSTYILLAKFREREDAIKNALRKDRDNKVQAAHFLAYGLLMESSNGQDLLEGIHKRRSESNCEPETIHFDEFMDTMSQGMDYERAKKYFKGHYSFCYPFLLKGKNKEEDLPDTNPQ